MKTIQLKLWAVLIAAIGLRLKTRTVWQMHESGMTKVEEEFIEYHGPMAYANAGAGGRPVLTSAQLQQYSVGTGTSDVIWNPLYDSISYPSAGLALFSFYSNPIGQGISSTPGAGAVAKTIYDTNLTIGNQLTSGNEFYMIGSESAYMPGVSNAALPLTVLPGRVNDAATSTSIGIFVNDVWSVGQGGIKTLKVGTDRTYLQDGPLMLFPPTARLAVAAALAGSTLTTIGMEIAYAAWSGETYTIVPVYIQSNQNWTLTVAYNTIIPTPSAQIGRLMDRMRGYLIRQAT